MSLPAHLNQARPSFWLLLFRHIWITIRKRRAVVNKYFNKSCKRDDSSLVLNLNV
jgi:hypothetical protein